GPDGFTGVGPPRKDRACPFVIARPLVRIPWAWIRRSIVDEIQLWVIGNPSPDAASADLPQIRRPALDPEVFATFVFVERLKIGADQNIAVGSGGERTPQN